jgi:diguanylate cyclase (GGDEF)-like protein/PAS domain S-box-containing protein
MTRSLAVARWTRLLLAGIVVVTAGLVVSKLHARSLAAAARERSMLDVRAAVIRSDGLAWAAVAQGRPNVTSDQGLSAQRATITRNLQYLIAESDDPGIRRLSSLSQTLDADIDSARAQIAKRHHNDAVREVLNGVEGITASMTATISAENEQLTARLDSANANLYDGTLLALGATGGLAALLALDFAAARRRALAAERAAIARSERRFRALVHKSSEVVIVVGADGRVSYVTDAAQTILGLSTTELIGRPMEAFLPSSEQSRAHSVFERNTRGVGGPGAPNEWIYEHPNGTEIVLEARSDNLLDDPDVNGLVVTVRDVSDRRQMEVQLRHQALHDSLTGLANRTLFEDRVRQALQRGRRRGLRTSVIYIDLDEFKAVNDSLGHAAGDELLRVVAGRIDSCLRAADTPARLGGDEFACLLEDLDNAEDPFTIARRIAAALEPPAAIGDRQINIRASLGIAFSSDAIDSEQLVRHADLAMYSAKESGGSEIAAFHDDLLVAAHHRLQLREDLPAAAARGEMTLAYQPLVEVASDRIVGVEALLRWTHPEHGAITPDRFIPLAEECGAILEIGRWVLNQALLDLARLSHEAPELRLNVNVAPRELEESDYLETVVEALRRHDIDPRRLTVEVTESELLSDGLTLPNLRALSDLGVGISIDDFGTGQSSLARLQRLPVNQVKMDRSFLAAVDESIQDAILLRSVLELAQALGLQMVAEGIERDSQAQVLRDSECPLGQGFFFARPQPVDAVAALLRRSRNGSWHSASV